MIIVCASIDPHRVVVPADRVERIGEHADAAEDERGATDVAALLGLRPPVGPRRALRVKPGGEEAARWVVVGEQVAVRQVPRDAFGAWPRWLDALGAKLPVAGLVALDGAFAFELDVARLLAREAR